MKILILKPSSLGDVVQAMPVLRLIKGHLPKSRIYWWIETGLAGLFEEDPDLDGTVLFHRNGSISPKGARQLWRDLRWMRSQKFDWVIDLQCLARSGIVAWLANGNFTVGLDEAREGARCLYDVFVRRSRTQPHAVDWYLDVLQVLGVPRREFTWLPTKASAHAGIRKKWPVDSSRWIVIQPGARWVTKLWPAENFASVVQRLAQRHDSLKFVVLGTSQDRHAASQILRASPSRCLDLTGQLNLPEMIEWIRASELMVGNDTGPMHVAAALGKPVVAIFGPTDPNRTGPYGQLAHALQARIPCSPCFSDRCGNRRNLECLHAISPGMVVQRVEEILSNRNLVMPSWV